MRKLLVLAAAVALPASFAAPAEAAAVRYCVATGTATFSPPLSTVRQTGTMTWDYDATCVIADTGGASGATTSSGTHTYGYDGSCLTASMTGPGGDTGLMVGGLAMATYDVNVPGKTFARAWLFVPGSLNPCAQGGATVVQTGPDVWLP
jgi:hypothetical protein